MNRSFLLMSGPDSQRTGQLFSPRQPIGWAEKKAEPDDEGGADVAKSGRRKKNQKKVKSFLQLLISEDPLIVSHPIAERVIA